MKIAFFCEGNIKGKIPRNWENMRTDMAWICALDADRIPYMALDQIDLYYDLGIAIIPKNNPQFNINQLRNHCKKLAVMQEGPNWYW